jgi:hypothetical protein
MSEDVNFPRHRAAELLKVQTPMLMRENHLVDTLVYDQTDFEHLTRHFDHSKYTVKEPVLAGNPDKIKSQYIADFLKYRFEQPSPELYSTSSKFIINFYSPGVLINPYRIPLLNTAILLTSGFILTMAHSYLRIEYFLAAFRFLNLTILLGLLFIMLQIYEYTFSGFSMNDGVYGSIFYMLTGFHGFHVIVGTIFLIVCTCRLRASHFTSNNHFAFEAAA